MLDALFVVLALVACSGGALFLWVHDPIRTRAICFGIPFCFMFFALVVYYSGVGL